MSFALPDITISQLMFRIAGTAITLAVYGFAVVWAATRVGDNGPKYDGRQTPNPLTHLDIVGLIASIFYRVGWVRPIDFTVDEMRAKRSGAVIVMMVGTVAALVLAVLALSLRQVALRLLDLQAGLNVSAVLTTTSEIAIGTALIGLLPIPPLLGALWWGVISPGAAKLANRPRVRFVGYLLVGLLLFSGVTAPLLRNLTNWLVGLAGF